MFDQVVVIINALTSHVFGKKISYRKTSWVVDLDCGYSFATLIHKSNVSKRPKPIDKYQISP